MTKQLEHQALVDFTRRWLALWTEADSQAPSRQVAALWAPAGARVLVDPPQEVRDAATAWHSRCLVSRCEATTRSNVGCPRQTPSSSSPAYTHSRRQAMLCSWHQISSGWDERWSPSLTGPSPGAATT